MEVIQRHERSIEFVAVGHLAVDHREGRRILGGAAAYSCLAASRLGLAAAMVTSVGDRFNGFAPLAGVEVHFHRVGSSTSFENIYRGATRHQRLLGRAATLTENDLAHIVPRLADDAIVLYCPIAGEVRAPLRPLTRRGLCGVAPQGFFRGWDEAGRVLAAPWRIEPGQLAAVDVISTSATDPPQPEDFVREVVDQVPLLAVTDAERGARIYFQGRGVQVPADRREPVDPTGAGDVFAASLLVALREGMDPIGAAQFACCTASFAVEGEGLWGMPPSREAVDERLSRYRARYHPKEIAP